MVNSREALGIPPDVKTLKEAAKLTGYNRSHLRRLCEDPESGVNCWKPERDWLISLNSLRAYIGDVGVGPQNKRTKL